MVTDLDAYFFGNADGSDVMWVFFFCFHRGGRAMTPLFRIKDMSLVSVYTSIHTHARAHTHMDRRHEQIYKTTHTLIFHGDEFFLASRNMNFLWVKT